MKMNEDRQIQYYAKMTNALQSLFDEDGINFIDMNDRNFYMNDFIHVLATRVPQMIASKIANIKGDPLEFNYMANRLIMQDRLDNSKPTKK